jgi:hypothetical protein
MPTRRKKPRLMTCKWCGEENLAWFQAPSGRWYLATPKNGSQTPQRPALHLCDERPPPPIREQHRSRPSTVHERRKPVDTELHRAISKRLNRPSRMFPENSY